MRDGSHSPHRGADYGDSAKRRTLMDGVDRATARQRAVRRGPAPRVLDLTPPHGMRIYDAEYAEAEYGEYGEARSPSSSGRRRERTAARPLGMPSLPRRTMELEAVDDEPEYGPPDVLAPDLATYRQTAIARRPRLDTRALVRRARSPWSLARTLLAVLALSAALWTGVAHAGEPSQPLMADSWQTTAGAHVAAAITSLVQPETQGTRPDLYDSYQQFSDWWDAACSAAVMSEVLTAWSVQHVTIGKMIDVMQPDISLNGGLLTTHGFMRGAAAFGFRADISQSLTYKQMEYITNTLGLPIIVNVRISYGYYHFFSGGHFLVMTGGDDQGLRIVDSSEYYIHYLPKDTFDSMFTGVTAVIVPNGYDYTVPSI
ncbi:MAG TPA: hypothetical protein VKT52_01495 [Ktedonobacterales bacterium]|nr:hypothetical protein [Ktedonobacterales bacterium]